MQSFLNALIKIHIEAHAILDIDLLCKMPLSTERLSYFVFLEPVYGIEIALVMIPIHEWDGNTLVCLMRWLDDNAEKDVNNVKVVAGGVRVQEMFQIK